MMPFIAQRARQRSAQAPVSAAPLPTARVYGLLCVLLMAGCAAIERTPQPEAPPVTAAAGATALVEPTADQAAPAPEPPQRKAAERVAVAPDREPAVLPAAPPASDGLRPEGAKPAASTAKAPAKPAPPPPPAVQAAKTATPAQALAKPPATPPLDLKSLETRLKETKAIGVFTKLTLKNQIDDLLNRFRAYYQGRLKATLAELRQAYDRLLLKVLALLQDTDPPLAVAIASSRESIWGILSNPAKFATV